MYASPEYIFFCICCLFLYLWSFPRFNATLVRRIVKRTRKGLNVYDVHKARYSGHRVIDKAEHLDVVKEVPNHEELSAAIKRFDPEWVIVSLPFGHHEHSWIHACLAEYPSVRFMFLSPHQTSIKMKWQTSYEEDYSDLSLEDFIHILERDLQHT
jgi:hypothetical protein